MEWYSIWDTPCVSLCPHSSTASTEQANAFIIPLTTVGVCLALEYSLEASEVVESMAGFEYDDCCWRVRPSKVICRHARWRYS